MSSFVKALIQAAANLNPQMRDLFEKSQSASGASNVPNDAQTQAGGVLPIWSYEWTKDRLTSTMSQSCWRVQSTTAETE
jgi:hypothetical protein